MTLGNYKATGDEQDTTHTRRLNRTQNNRRAGSIGVGIVVVGALRVAERGSVAAIAVGFSRSWGPGSYVRLLVAARLLVIKITRAGQTKQGDDRMASCAKKND